MPIAPYPHCRSANRERVDAACGLESARNLALGRGRVGERSTCKNLDAYDTTHRFPAVYAELGDGFIELLQFPPVRLEVGIFLGDPLLLFGDGR